MVTIHNVEVTFEVEGDDQATFAKHFREAITKWHRAQREKDRDEHQAERDRSLLPLERR
jgi:hypothetical protein